VTLGVTGGDSLILPGKQAISLKQLKTTHEAWLPTYMTGKS
jgi:phosphoribosylformylglycinamidine synthase subunit PurL